MLSDPHDVSNCPFCDASDAIRANRYAYLRMDKFPVNPGHCLVIPRRHFPDFFDATKRERLAVLELVDIARELLADERKPDGYNLGVNVGTDAGQTVMHAHLHIIPRFRADVADPSGGVRGVIPSKQHY